MKDGVIVFWLIIHTRIEDLRPFGTRAYWTAAFAWTVTAGPILFFRREIFSIRWVPSRPVELLQDTLGVLAFLLGALLYSLAKRQISTRTMIGFPEMKPKENPQPMLSLGIYSKTRNPLYLGYWLVLLAAALLTSYAANWIMFAANCIFLPLMIHDEERELLSRYGSEFADYMRSVLRFFPRFL